MIDILIKSFSRLDVTIQSVKNLRKFFTGRIVIADSSSHVDDYFKKQMIFYDVEFYKLDYNIGLSAGRNFLISQVKENKFLLLDNDFFVMSIEDIEKMCVIMDHTDAVIVGGLLWDKGTIHPRYYSGYFSYESEIILNIYNSKETFKKCYKGIQFYECRFCQNFMLGDRQKFNKFNIKWNEKLKLMEHEDFFIRIPSNLKIIELPDIFVEHYPSLPTNNNPRKYSGWNNIICDQQYNSFRHNVVHKRLLKKLYGYKNDFFTCRENVVYDWRNGFPTLPFLHKSLN